jgi:hypothetical protein
MQEAARIREMELQAQPRTRPRRFAKIFFITEDYLDNLPEDPPTTIIQPDL